MQQADIKNHLQLVMEELYRLGMPRTCAHFVAGGAIASLVLDEQPKDYDVWFGSLEDWNAAVNGLLGTLPATRMSKYSFTYTLPSGKIVQLVRSRVGTIHEVVSTFDFKHTQGYYSPGMDVMEYDEEFIKSKALTFNKGNLCHPVNTVQRLLKFSRRGYSINNQTIADIMNEVGEIYYQKRLDHDDESPDTDFGTCFHPGWGGGGEEDSR